MTAQLSLHHVGQMPSTILLLLPIGPRVLVTAGLPQRGILADWMQTKYTYDLKQSLSILDASFRVLSPGASTLHHEPYRRVEALRTLDQAAEQMHQI